MKNSEIWGRFQELNTPVIIDACLRVKAEYNVIANKIKPINSNHLIAGTVRPVKHYGSVDIFLEAMMNSDPGDILVIDNQGRKDEACVGDLTALEAKGHGIAAFVIWGLHRDERELLKIDFPTFSYGRHPSGPTRLDQQERDALLTIKFEHITLTGGNVAFGDINGVVFVKKNDVRKILEVAEEIWEKEREQIKQINSGNLLVNQFRFQEYLDERSKSPKYTFREHLRKIGGEIEQ
jgi:regulator of RNase E activity RraA